MVVYRCVVCKKELSKVISYGFYVSLSVANSLWIDLSRWRNIKFVDEFLKKRGIDEDQEWASCEEGRAKMRMP